ncbi:MAG: hypothetical protein IJW31_00805 [Lentisphaeria bacterium]|nr:hypothetical protein [Lentisphaeria bacterium]MBR7128499.1 hypothetical protein [Lentisphaeria bacterium]
MKKFLVAVIAVFAAVSFVKADESFACGFWFDAPANIAKTNVEGLALGIPVIASGDMEGASLAICGNDQDKVTGFQFAWLGYNYAKSLEGVQLAFINVQDGQHGDFAFQWGFYNQAKENGVQIGFLNNGQNNATFQLGLVNINKGGLLPVMVFVNFGKDLFD